MAGASQSDISKISGPDSMAMPSQSAAAGLTAVVEGSASRDAAAASASSNVNDAATSAPKKKRHRAGKKKRKSRKLSIIAPSESTEGPMDNLERPSLLNASRASTQQANLDRLRTRNPSNTSLESEALLDHRDQAPIRARGYSLRQDYSRASNFYGRPPQRGSEAPGFRPGSSRTPRLPRGPEVAISDGEEDHDSNDRTPLLRSSRKPSKPGVSRNNSAYNKAGRQPSTNSKASSRRRLDLLSGTPEDSHDVNNPPSMPGSPQLGSFEDVYIPDIPEPLGGHGRDAIITIDGEGHRYSTSTGEGGRRRNTLAKAELDVCFPEEGESEYGEDHYGDGEQQSQHESAMRRRRRRLKAWPDFEVLEEWAREEKEARTEQEFKRAKKITEPELFGGRLRPRTHTDWRTEEDNSFRFAYFNDTFDTTIHSQTLGNLLDDGNLTFQELFKPDYYEDSDSEDTEVDKDDDVTSKARSPPASVNQSLLNSNPPSGQETPKLQNGHSKRTRYARPTFWLDVRSPTQQEMQVLQDAFGIHRLTTEDIMTEDPRDKLELFPHYYFLNYRTFDQDRSSDEYMKPINMSMVVFREGIISFHQQMVPHCNNVRRRIRQLRDYGATPSADWISYALVDDVTDAYQPLVNQTEHEVDQIDEEILYMHRTAVSDMTAEDEKKPKRRPRGWKSWRIWRWIRGFALWIWRIFYFIFLVLKFIFYGAWKNIWDDIFNSDDDDDATYYNQADMGASKAADADPTAGPTGADTLRRVGETRKDVMTLFRLLGSKADVVKSFVKRCNEQSRGGAPRADIAMYLSDIHDHVVTMSGNLTHYESLLSRAHSNYVAQINIRMNERAEQNADVLGKLTVLGTIVLPMNIITGMWGMNVWVPGQEYEGDLTWFWSITAGLVLFGVTCYFIAKKAYGIV